MTVTGARWQAMALFGGRLLARRLDGRGQARWRWLRALPRVRRAPPCRERWLERVWDGLPLREQDRYLRARAAAGHPVLGAAPPAVDPEARVADLPALMANALYARIDDWFRADGQRLLSSSSDGAAREGTSATQG